MQIDQTIEPDLFYHVSCVEQICDVRTLLESKELGHEGRFPYKSDGFGVALKDRFMHVAIEDWFDSNGASSDLEDYAAHREAHDSWKIMYGTYLERHLVHGRSVEAGRLYGPEPEKSVYSTTHREPRLLSDVLAAVAKVKQIDGMPRRWLKILSASADETPEDGEGEGASENKGKGSLRAAERST
jgi:hypothetical protein